MFQEKIAESQEQLVYTLLLIIDGAKVATIYLNEHEDTNETKRLIEEVNGECLLISGDISESFFYKLAVGK